jgi:RNA polymerase sigma factor (sigma-70 family)
MEADWESIGKALTAYAIRKAARYIWRSKNPLDLPKGFSPEDVAHEAITRVWEHEKRKWDPQKNPELLKYLEGVVDSLIWSHLKSEDHEKTVYFPTDETGRDLRDEVIAAVQEDNPILETSRSSPFRNPEDKQIESDEERAADMLLDQLYEITSGDPEVQEIIECKMDGLKPREMAERLGAPITDVRNRIKRLMRYRSQLYFGPGEKN